MPKKIAIEFENHEYRALCKDSRDNIRDPEMHIRYLVRYHLVGARDAKIDSALQKAKDACGRLIELQRQMERTQREIQVMISDLGEAIETVRQEEEQHNLDVLRGEQFLND